MGGAEEDPSEGKGIPMKSRTILVLAVAVCVSTVGLAWADVPPVPPPERSAESSLSSLVDRVALFEVLVITESTLPTDLKSAVDAQKTAASVLFDAVGEHGDRYPDAANRQAQHYLQGEISRMFVADIRTWNPPPPDGWPGDEDAIREYRELIDELKIELAEPYEAKMRALYEHVLEIAGESGVESEWVGKAKERLAALPEPVEPGAPAPGEPGAPAPGEPAAAE
jgi:hypothetical protein